MKAHIRVFNKAIQANGETMEVDIINLFGFTLRASIFEWGENYETIQTTFFEELEQAFCKRFKTVKND
jgi:hypothetical protein